ncbi:MAG: fumarylacetoacetase [Dermatophilaceae bacterium]
MTTWPDVPDDHLFGREALPYGVMVTSTGSRIVVRYGDHALDLRAVADLEPDSAWARAWREPTLDAFLALGRRDWDAARVWLRDALADPGRQEEWAAYLTPVEQVSLALPFTVGDYVDCYASEHHATNVGRIFRPDGEALTPNWRHLPIGYHGRSQTVVVTGTDVVRPTGQRKPPTSDTPVFGPSVRLDIEAELGFVVGGPRTTLGSRVSVDEADEHLFGVVLLNDWSARDIQAWEYVPLGPFLGKSFATSISGWVLPMAALSAARVPLPIQEPLPLPYLCGHAATGYDVHLEVAVNGSVVSRPEYAGLYWAPQQMLAHMTVNGATTGPGDLFGSGTISGPRADQRGSFLELSWNGTEPFALADGTTRTFLEDGDTVTLRAWAPGPTPGSRIGLGEVTGRITSAR